MFHLQAAIWKNGVSILLGWECPPIHNLTPLLMVSRHFQYLIGRYDKVIQRNLKVIQEQLINMNAPDIAVIRTLCCKPPDCEFDSDSSQV